MMKPKKAKTEPTPTSRIQEALAIARYRRIAIFQVDQQNTSVGTIETWMGPRQTLILIVFDDGGCELYKPVTESLGIEDTIKAIPA